MQSNEKLVSNFYTDLEHKKTIVPYAVYVKSLQLLIAYQIGHVSEAFIEGVHRAVTVPSESFWQEVTNTANDYIAEYDLSPPIHDYEVIDTEPEWEWTTDKADLPIISLFQYLYEAAKKRDHRSWGEIQKDLNNVKQASANLRSAISKLSPHYTDDLFTAADDIDFLKHGISEYTAGPSSIVEYQPILSQLEKYLDEASYTGASQKGTNRHTYFAIQVSNWFKKYSEKPKKILSIEVTQAILLDEDSTIPTFKNCLNRTY